MTYPLPEYTRMTLLPKQGRQEMYRVEGFKTKAEADEYAEWVYYSQWGYGPTTKVSQADNLSYTVDVKKWDSCD